ncbi:DNA endonuclease SmrA [Shewanella dokdonensis]|uniref:DNA endonuclease SmrA n=1 Tax=Shewanella dokdonensis TaxID=712036 RepID=A0ABX8DE00_9GAMM|nr:DNA endonuclease SmrA [Shewanella dokdonensis]MCL1073166.1 DNA endonuclease SmrA [Shewanella dokdonensis]QVK22964.1 DNA endonuclease SmrA [Shewanella dokdonensis]
MNQNDMDLFKQEMADVVPLKQCHNVPTTGGFTTSAAQRARNAAAQSSEYLQRLPLELARIPPVKPDDMLSFKREGVQDAVFKNLRLGKYKVAAELDVHGMNVRQARDSLISFILQQQQRGARCLLLIHGKGHSNKPFPALIKSCVNYWLTQLDEVLAFHSAKREQGGYGALYLLLPKNEQQRLENREINRRGGHLR